MSKKYLLSLGIFAFLLMIDSSFASPQNDFNKIFGELKGTYLGTTKDYQKCVLTINEHMNQESPENSTYLIDLELFHEDGEQDYQNGHNLYLSQYLGDTCGVGVKISSGKISTRVQDHYTSGHITQMDLSLDQNGEIDEANFFTSNSSLSPFLYCTFFRMNLGKKSSCHDLKKIN